VGGPELRVLPTRGRPPTYGSGMSTMPEDARGPAPVPAGYRPGDYVPYKDRDPANPSSVAGQWHDPARVVQDGGGRRLTAEEQYRAIYGADAKMRVAYASWGRRVLAGLLDGVIGTIAGFPAILGYVLLLQQLQWTTDPYGNRVVSETSEVGPEVTWLFILGGVMYVAFFLWNAVFRQGRTGYTLGKTVLGIRLVGATSGEPIGAGMSFVRQLTNYINSFVCYLGWFWPLWDPRNQTLSDKIVGTVVVVQAQDELPPPG